MKMIRLMQLFLMAALLSSCEKDGLVNRAEQASLTRLMFVHAGPTALQFNFFVNEVKITGAVPTAAGLTQGMAYSTANLPAYFGYSSVREGDAAVKVVTPEASSSPAPGTVLASFNHRFEKDKSYSVFVYEPATPVKTMVLEDNLVLTGKGGIRFVNLMPGGIAVDLEMSYIPHGGTTQVVTRFASNVPYMGVVGFIDLEPNTYTFQRKRAGTNTDVGTALTITRLKANQNFTLCARGTTAALLQIPHQ